MTRNLTGTIEIQTAAMTVTGLPPAFTGETGALGVSFSFLDGGTAADLSGYGAEMYLFWPEDGRMTGTVPLTISGSTAAGGFSEQMTARAGVPLLVVQLRDDDSGSLVVACSQPVRISGTRGEAVLQERAATPSEIVYVGRAPYVDPSTKEWMVWDNASSRYVSTGASTTNAAADAETAAGLANTAATNADAAKTAANSAAASANAAASAIQNMTASATTLSPGSAATAYVSTQDGHKHIAFGIPKGDTTILTSPTAENIPMSSNDPTTVAAAIDAAAHSSDIPDQVLYVDGAQQSAASLATSSELTAVASRVTALETLTSVPVFLSGANGDYTLQNIVKTTGADPIVQTNTMSGWNQLTLGFQTTAQITSGTKTKIAAIPAAAFAVVGKTYVVGLGRSGSTLVEILFDSYTDNDKAIYVTPAATLASGASISGGMAFPVTP